MGLTEFDLTNANKKENQVPEEDKQLIAPTATNTDEGTLDHHVDLSAIIPQDDGTNNALEGINLLSKDNSLKSDGTIVIATVQNESEIVMTQGAAVPSPIDIEQRKKDKKELEMSKKLGNKASRNVKGVKKEAKLQNVVAVGALITIIGLGGFVYYYKNKGNADDFSVKQNVEIELRGTVPTNSSAYVITSNGKSVDDLKYKLNIKGVNADVISETPYTYTVTYNGITKQGTIIIVDTTPPTGRARAVEISEGDSYNAEQFVYDDYDDNSSVAKIYFKDEDMANKKDPGTYDIVVVLEDAYGNKTEIKSTLTIVEKGMWIKYTKAMGFNSETGCSETRLYEIKYSEIVGNRVFLAGTLTTTYKYASLTEYETAYKTYNGEQNYEYDKTNLTITHKETINNVGYSTKYEEIEEYLVNSNGYTREVK